MPVDEYLIVGFKSNLQHSSHEAERIGEPSSILRNGIPSRSPIDVALIYHICALTLVIKGGTSVFRVSKASIYRCWIKLSISLWLNFDAHAAPSGISDIAAQKNK